MENKIKNTNTKTGLGTASLTLGILGFLFAFIPLFGYTSFLLGLLAFNFGCIGTAKYLKKGTSVAGLILGIFAILIAVIMQFTVYNAIKGAVDDVSSGINMMSGNATDEILEKYADVSIGKFTVKESDFLSETSLPVKIKNKSKERKSFSVKIEAIDKSGDRIKEDTLYISDLNAGQSKSDEAFTLIKSKDIKKLKKAKFKIVEISMY